MKMQSQFWRWKPAYLLLAVILIAALFFALPQGRAMGQAVLRFFQHGESNLMPGVTVTPVKWVEQTPGVAAATLTSQPTPPGPAFESACGSYQAPHCTIEAIRSLVNYPIFALPNLPEGMRFLGATGGPDQVHLFYDTPNQTGSLILLEKPFTGTESQLSMEVGKDAQIESVQVGSAQAEYVKGSYDGSSNPPVWNSNLDLQQLRWVNQGVLFTLYMSGTEPQLSRDNLVALAASLTDGPIQAKALTVAATATPAPSNVPIDLPTPSPLTLEQVKEKAGFTPLSPTHLPETLIFAGGFYDDQSSFVRLTYHYNDPNFPENTDGLSLYEENLSNVTACQLCGFVAGQYTGFATSASLGMVGANAAIETVQIGNVKGEYVEGVWNGTDQGWVWVSDPYVKTLRWHRNDMAFELKYFGLAITKDDMIAIAESMK